MQKIPSAPRTPGKSALAALVATLVFAQLGGCSDDSHSAKPPISAQPLKGESPNATAGSKPSVDVVKTSADAKLASTAEIDALTASMAKLEAQRTELTKKISQVTVATASVGVESLAADQANAKHNSTADGIGLAAGAAGVALSVATGGVFGVILGGIGVANSAIALSNDKKAEDLHKEIITTNTATLEQAAVLKANFEADLAKVNGEIAKVQAQIDDYNATQLKILTAK